MFRATALSGSVVYGSQRSACSFTIWFGNFEVQDSMYYPRSLELKLTTRERSSKVSESKAYRQKLSLLIR
jgi:hypothetical protein